jgi:hypothetical protein
VKKSTKRRSAILATTAALVATLFVAPSAASAPTPQQAAVSSGVLQQLCQRAFDRAVTDYNTAFANRDLAALMEFYRDDAVKVDPDGKIQYGKTEIAALFGQLFELTFTESFPHLYKKADCRTAVLLTNSKLVFPEWEYEERFFTTLTYTFDGLKWRVLSSTSTNLVTSGG